MARLMMTVLWPSFLVAILADGVFFSLFDPHDLSVLGSSGGEMTPIAVYTLGFFFFWGLCALASMLTYYLMAVPDNRHSPL